MGRKKKYASGATTITLSIETSVLENIVSRAKVVGLNKSEFINHILKGFAFKSEAFCKLMAKQAAQDLYYWNSRAKAIESNPELFEDNGFH